MYKVPKTLKSINVLGKDVKIKFSNAKLDANQAYGMYDREFIYLRTQYDTYETFICTLVHESFHAHCHIVGLQLDLQVEEVLAVTSERLFESMRKVLSTQIHTQD